MLLIVYPSAILTSGRSTNEILKCYHLNESPGMVRFALNLSVLSDNLILKIAAYHHAEMISFSCLLLWSNDSILLCQSFAGY